MRPAPESMVKTLVICTLLSMTSTQMGSFLKPDGWRRALSSVVAPVTRKGWWSWEALTSEHARRSSPLTLLSLLVRISWVLEVNMRFLPDANLKTQASLAQTLWPSETPNPVGEMDLLTPGSHGKQTWWSQEDTEQERPSAWRITGSGRRQLLGCILKDGRILTDDRGLARKFVKNRGRNEVIPGRWGTSIAYFYVVVWILKLDCIALNSSSDSIMVKGKVLSGSRGQS